MGRSKSTLDYEFVDNFDLRADPSIDAPVYIGLAKPGTGTDEAGWQINKLAAGSLLWPNQNLPTDSHGDVSPDDFKFIWDDRADYFA